ncbi:MAG TPA: four helix bundle protein [Candidatus Sulfotelmatobacter sp.]|nr:four helix bundle protein [Candidatus Sulfotelmatobacter sp.]
MTDFKQLKVWRKAHEMTLDTYRVTAAFPKEEMYGLTSQLRRASASIGANIAEGCGRRSDGEMCRFLQIARGSASEVEYHFLLARDLRFLDEKEFQKLTRQADELQRMLTGLMQSVRSPKNVER